MQPLAAKPPATPRPVLWLPATWFRQTQMPRFGSHQRPEQSPLAAARIMADNAVEAVPVLGGGPHTTLRIGIGRAELSRHDDVVVDR